MPWLGRIQWATLFVLIFEGAHQLSSKSSIPDYNRFVRYGVALRYYLDRVKNGW